MGLGGGGGIVSVVCFVVLSKVFKPFLWDLHESCNMTHILHYPIDACDGRDGRWRLSHFWRHHLWWKLASNVYSQSFQWYLDQSTESIEPEIHTKMLRNCSKKLEANFPSTTLGLSVSRIAKCAPSDVMTATSQTNKMEWLVILKNSVICILF